MPNRAFSLRSFLSLLKFWYGVILIAKINYHEPILETLYFLLQGKTFPEITKDPETAMEIINDEEKQFLKTLSRGKVLFQKSINQLPKDAKVFPGMG